LEKIMTDVALRLKEELLRLPEEDRFQLAQALWESLEEKHESSDQDEAAWIAELNRRADDLAAGRAIAEPVDKVFADLQEECVCEKRQ
jgi:putative addiction module component (TIGR02574 family)